MQKVITVNLNGVAYQFDEDAYGALQQYLDRAQAQLKDNPDRAEIIADLEQAIAEKCSRYLNAHKNVVTAVELQTVLSEMGPVNAPGGTESSAGAASGASAQAPKSDAGSAPRTGAPKRLYQIRQGAMIAGVCNGLGAYFGLDPTIVRVAFALLTLVTRGWWILVYFVLMVVIPTAETSEQEAAARGVPFNAQELIDRARRNFGQHKQWRRQWKWQQRRWRQEWRRSTANWGTSWGPPPPPSYGAHFGMGLLMPVFAFVNGVSFVFLVYVIFSLVNTRAVLGWALPSGLPVWGALLLAFIAYQVVMTPIRVTRHVALRWYGGHAAWDGLFGLIVLGTIVWMFLTHQAEARDALQQFGQNIPGVWRDFRQAVSGLFR